MGKLGIFEPGISWYIPLYYQSDAQYTIILPLYYQSDAQYTIILVYLKRIKWMGGGRWPRERNKMGKMEYLHQCMYYK